MNVGVGGGGVSVCEVVIWENYNVALHAWLPNHKLPLSENQTKSPHLQENKTKIKVNTKAVKI